MEIHDQDPATGLAELIVPQGSDTQSHTAGFEVCGAWIRVSEVAQFGVSLSTYNIITFVDEADATRMSVSRDVLPPEGRCHWGVS